MPKYATQRELIEMVKSLTADRQEVALFIDVARLTILFNMTIEMVTNPELEEVAQAKMMEFAKELADVLEDKRPDVEPFIAYQFGMIAMRRAGAV